jgi:hypothetical protein
LRHSGSCSKNGNFISFKSVFKPDTPTIDESCVDVWLVDLPDLAQECETKTLSSVVGEEVTVRGHILTVESETYKDVFNLFTPKLFFARFSVKNRTGQIRRIFEENSSRDGIDS